MTAAFFEASTEDIGLHPLFILLLNLFGNTILPRG
jgi:hypothetical protein